MIICFHEYILWWKILEQILLEPIMHIIRTPAIISENKDREIGRVFAEYKDKLIIVDGEIKKRTCVI